MPEPKRRGIRTAFQADGITLTKAMGRSEDLVHKRNERLCARLYWYKRETEYSYDAVLKKLQQEFDISPVTISKIIQEDQWQAELRKLRNKNPTIDFLRRKWPWMKWVVKENTGY